ncbi:MAG: galactitol-1-phosphate 5-dehydrogenase [Oscillospiraceae bacterium]
MKTLIEIPEKMKALVLHAVGDLTLDTVDVPKLEAGTVLVQIKASGICSSDIDRVFLNGTYHFPTIPGHEFSGQIVAVGDGVDDALLGRRTCVFPLLPCKTCRACRMEEYAQCSGYSYFGSRCDGAFAEYLVVPVWNLVPFDDSIPYETAALCEPAAVSLHAINIAKAKKDDTVAVIGTGTIGFLIALLIKKHVAKVIMLGRSGDKLTLAQSLGLEAVDTGEADYMDKIKAITGGDGADICFEAVGSNAAIASAITATGALGKVILVGNPHTDLALEKNVYWSVLRKQLTLSGSWNSNYNRRINDWATAMEVFKSGDMGLEKLITHTYPLEEYKTAFDDIKDNAEFTLKVMFRL